MKSGECYDIVAAISCDWFPFHVCQFGGQWGVDRMGCKPQRSTQSRKRDAVGGRLQRTKNGWTGRLCNTMQQYFLKDGRGRDTKWFVLVVAGKSTSQWFVWHCGSKDRCFLGRIVEFCWDFDGGGDHHLHRFTALIHRCRRYPQINLLWAYPRSITGSPVSKRIFVSQICTQCALKCSNERVGAPLGPSTHYMYECTQVDCWVLYSCWLHARFQ